MRIIKTKSYEEMSKKAANIIASVVTLKPDCMLGLATGSSPIGTYDELVKKYEAGDLDFSEVTTKDYQKKMNKAITISCMNTYSIK